MAVADALEFVFGSVPQWRRPRQPREASAGSVAETARAAANPDLPLSYSISSAQAESVLRLSAVHRAVSLITGAISSMPLDVIRRRGAARLQATDSPVYRLLTRRPNGWQTPQQWKRVIATHLLLHGNAYLLKVGAGRRVSQLVPLSPNRIRVEQLPDWSLRYHYSASTGVVELGQADLIHFVGLSLDGITGVSVLRAAAETLGYGASLQRFGRSVVENGARFSGSITHPRTLGPEATERLRASLEAYRGSANAGKLLVLEEGMKVETFQMSMDDAQFIETLGANRLEIYQFFGIPPFLAGDQEKSTSWGSGIEAMNQAFLDYTLNDWLVTIEETLNNQLIVEDDVFVRFNRNSLVRANIQTRFEAYEKGIRNGFLTVEEARALEDMNPLEDRGVTQ